MGTATPHGFDDSPEPMVFRMIKPVLNKKLKNTPRPGAHKPEVELREDPMPHLSETEISECDRSDMLSQESKQPARSSFYTYAYPGDLFFVPTMKNKQPICLNFVNL